MIEGPYGRLQQQTHLLFQPYQVVLQHLPLAYFRPRHMNGKERVFCALI